MPPLDPYVLKANAGAFSGLQVQLAEGELTAAKSSYNFNMDAEGFTLDNGVTNMSWDHVRIAAGHATDFQAIIPAVAGNPQATTLQINDKIAFNMSGSYAYMNKDEVHIFDNNTSHVATYGTSLVLENVSDNLLLDIGTDGISFTPGYTKISWPDILSAGLPFADSWLFAVNDNASYNTSTLVLNNTININDGTPDNTINITTVDQPSINLNKTGTSTSAISSVLNNTNLTITDANTDGAYNNGTCILDSGSLTLSHAPSYDYENNITLSTVDANLYIQTTAVEGLNMINVHASDGFYNSFTSADTFTQKTITFSKNRLSNDSTYNDGSDPLTALTDSFEITTLYNNMKFNLGESNPISNDSSALNSYQQVSKNNDGVYKSTLDLTAFNAGTSVTNAITVTAVDTANSIANPSINLKVTDSTTTVLESTLANNLLTLTNKDTSLAYVAESLVINSSTYKSEYKTSETETNTVEISTATTSINLTESGTETNKATTQLSRTTLEITDYNTTAALNNTKSSITSGVISTEQTADGVNTYSVTISSADASIICSTPLDGTTETVTISPSQGFDKGFTSADTFRHTGATVNNSILMVYDNVDEGNASTSSYRAFEARTDRIEAPNVNMLMYVLNPNNSDQSRFDSKHQTSMNGDGIYKSITEVNNYIAETNTLNSITLTAIDTEHSISNPVIKVDVTGTSTSKPTGIFSNTELSITDLNADGEYNNSKTTVLSNNLSIATSSDGVNSKTITMNNTTGTTTAFSIYEVETNADSKTLTVNSLGLNVGQALTSLNQSNVAIVSPFDINSTSNFNDSTNNSVIKTLSYTNNTSTNYLTLSHSNPFTSDDSSFTANQRVSVSGDGVYKTNVLLESYNGTTEDINSITLTAVDTESSISNPLIKLDVTGTSTSKPTGTFSNTEMSFTDLNADGEYNNSKVTVLSKNLSIVSTTDGVNAKSISLNASGTAEIGISEVETNADYKILTVNTLGFNVNQTLTSLNTTKYVAVTPSAISSTTTFDDATINSVVKYLAYGNNTSTNFFSLVESNPFTEDQSIFSASQRVSVGGDGVYKSNLLVSNYNASTNTTKSIDLTAIDTDGSITDPVIKVNDGTIVSSLKSESLSSTGNLSLSVPTGKELTLAVPSGADLVIGDGAVSNVADGGLTNLWMRIKIGSSYYKIPLMADMAILDNSEVINADILDRLSQNINSLSVNDTYTLLLGKGVISYTGDREYWGPPQDTVSTYVSMNNTTYLKLSNFDYVGWDFNSINFTNAGTLNGKIFISLWTDISMTIRFSVVNTTIQSGGVSTEYKTVINTNNGTWTYVEVSLADLVFDKGDGSAAKATVFSNIRQFLFATDLNISNPVYIQYVALKRTP